jgi:phage gpG-like protein
MPSQAAPSFTTNANELVARLNRAGGKIEDPRALLERIRLLLQAQEQEVFSSEGAALGAAWKALVEPERGSGRTLEDSGAMMGSVSGGDAGRIRGATLRIHPKPYYSRWHQFGTVNMDARPFMGISDETNQLILEEFQRAIGQDLGA